MKFTKDEKIAFVKRYQDGEKSEYRKEFGTLK